MNYGDISMNYVNTGFQFTPINNCGVQMFNPIPQMQPKCQTETNVDTSVEHFMITEVGYKFSTLKKALKYAEEYLEIYPNYNGKMTICKVEPIKRAYRKTPPVIIEDLV